MTYHHLNTLTVFPERLRHNLSILSALHPGIQPVPVVKSNAYGHGIKILAPILSSLELPFVCVDSLYEAFELEKHGYRSDILIMGYVDPRDVPRRSAFLYAVSDIDHALALVKQNSRVRLHLFLDTGMHREGILLNKKAQRKKQKEGWLINSDDASFSPWEGGWSSELREGGLVVRDSDDANIFDTYTDHHLTLLAPHIEWVMSHLASPDNADVSDMQLRSFQEKVALLRSSWVIPKYIHILASGGLIHSSNYSDSPLSSHSTLQSFHSLARTGLAFYGYGHPDLLPALRCTTHIAQIKHIRAGESIGYDGTFTAQQSMKIAVLPIGYHDGMDRRLSSVGFVTVGKNLCPIVGRVSMNITTIDISDLPNASVGEEVVFIDENPDSPVSLEKQAARANMIPYDMLVHLSKEMFRMCD